jgi:hypothetical protein
MAGFQKHFFNHLFNVNLIQNSLSKNNLIYYFAKRLISAGDNYKMNKQISMTSALRKYRTIFDSKRQLIIDNSSILYSKPFISIKEALLDRTLLNSMRQTIYSADFTGKVINSS